MGGRATLTEVACPASRRRRSMGGGGIDENLWASRPLQERRMRSRDDGGIEKGCRPCEQARRGGGYGRNDEVWLCHRSLRPELPAEGWAEEEVEDGFRRRRN